MNKNNINKYWGNKILEWCIDNLGESKYHDSPPNLTIYIKRTKDKYFKDNKHVLGYFDEDDNVIIVFAKNHKSFSSFIGTIIHEYTHYKQNIAGRYDKLLEKSNYDNHPFEIEAREAEKKYLKECNTYLKKFL
jgi:Zn-dependent peptidase ImmA (M78 family)